MANETENLTQEYLDNNEITESQQQNEIDSNDTAGISKSRNAAWIRLTIASTLAVLILCLTGFGGIKILLGGSELNNENFTEGKYLTFNVDTLLDYLAEDYEAKTDTVTGRYALVPMNGSLVMVHFPQRYLDSADAIAMQTYYVLYGYTSADAYFTASGTVKKAGTELTDKYVEWYNQNAIILYYYGMVENLDNPETFADNLYYIDVDSTGLFNDDVCTGLSFVAVACVLYALIVLIRILTGKYDEQDIVVEIIEDYEDEELFESDVDDSATVSDFAQNGEEQLSETEDEEEIEVEIEFETEDTEGAD